MSSTPARPASVPECAVFIPTSEEWTVGDVDEKGARLGPHSCYRADGTLAITCSYKSGVLDGPYRRFHPNGELARECLYVEGNIEGKLEAYASNDASPERLRSCCVPPGAYRMEARYDHGSLLGETFFNEGGQRILPDGSPYPEKPPHLPAEAVLDPFSKRWFAGEFSQGPHPATLRYWSVDGVLVEERQSQTNKLHGWLRTFLTSGELEEEAHYVEGVRSGPYRRVLPAPGIHADPRIREERGVMDAGFASGVWTFLDVEGRDVRTADFGVHGVDCATSPAFDRAALPAERWRQIAAELAQAHRIGEALCALARAGASSNDGTWLRASMSELRPELSAEQATTFAAAAISAADGKLDVLLDGLIRGGEPASLLRSIAASCPRTTQASLDLVNAAILLAPEWDQCRVTRALIHLSMGDPERAKEDAQRLGDEYATQRQFLFDYVAVLFPKFDFWPADARFDSLVADLPGEPCQPLSKVREAIQKCATRLQMIRGAIAELMGALPGWSPPDLSALLPNGPLALERRNFRVLLEEEEQPAGADGEPAVEEVALDEKLDLANRDIAPLMRLARSTWNVLTWLCWSAGLDHVALPERLAPPSNFSHAVGMAIERQWRAWDKFTTGGVVALTKGVRSFEWEGLDIDFVPPVIAEIVACEYMDLRAAFFFLCDDRQQSPWQDNLRD